MGEPLKRSVGRLTIRMMSILLKRHVHGLVAALCAVAFAIVGACEEFPDVHLDLKNNTSPISFSFDGRSPAVSFELSQLPKTRPLSKAYGLTGDLLWKISRGDTIKAANWPVVTYGNVPNGFSQNSPANGSPPQLSEDKLYAATIVGRDDYRMTMYLEIRNGRALNVTDKVFGP